MDAPAKPDQEQHADERASVGELAARVSQQVSQLLREEVQLATAEMATKGKRTGRGIGLVGGGGVLALSGLGCLLAAAVLGLATVWPAWLAALVVGLAVLILAGATALVGRQQARSAAPLVPEETVISLRETIDTVSEGAHR